MLIYGIQTINIIDLLYIINFIKTTNNFFFNFFSIYIKIENEIISKKRK